MGRRTSGATVGLETLGNVQANGTTLTTTQPNSDLTLDPNGTGGILLNGDVTILDQGDLRLREQNGNGTNYIALQAAANMASNYTLTFPAAVTGTNGFVLSSDTSGNLSWISLGGSITISDPGASSTVHYPFFGTSGGSLPTSIATINARTNLSFVPSTGSLNASIFVAPNHDGSTSASGTITIRGTSNATKSTASVLMTDGVASTSTTTGTLVVTGGVGVSGAIFASTGTVNGTWRSLLTESGKSASYTLAVADQDTVVSFSGSGSQTVTVPLDSTANFPVGAIVYINRVGSGTLTLAAEGGVSLTRTGTFSTNEEIYVRKRAANSWIVVDAPQLASATGGTISAVGGYRNVHTYTSGNSSFVIA